MKQVANKARRSAYGEWIGKCHFGDCRTILPTWPAGVADACITDPPYGDTSLEWDRRCDGWLYEVARVLKPDASIWIFGSMRFAASMFGEMDALGFKYAQDIVWQKQNGTGFQNDRFRRVHEHAVQFYRGVWADVYKEPQFTLDATARTMRRKTRPTHFGAAEAHSDYATEDGGPRLQRSVIDVTNEHGTALHPTQKPLGIIAPLIRYSVPVSGLVIDPFMGSGSVGIAAELLGRQFAGCELNPEYQGLLAQRQRQADLLMEVA